MVETTTRTSSTGDIASMLKDDGLRIRARTVEEQGRKYTEGLPKRDYRKVSNSVSDPPAGWSAKPG